MSLVSFLRMIYGEATGPLFLESPHSPTGPEAAGATTGSRGAEGTLAGAGPGPVCRAGLAPTLPPWAEAPTPCLWRCAQDSFLSVK